MLFRSPRPLYPGERPSTHCIGGWADPRAGLDGCGKSLPHRDSIPNLPTRSQSLYRLSYPTHKRNVSGTEKKSVRYSHDNLTTPSQHTQDSEIPYHHHSALVHWDNLASCEFEFLGDANHEYDTSLEGYRRPYPVALPCCIPHSARLKQKEKTVNNAKCWNQVTPDLP